ncbi:hypothetical protein BDV41DRAFT_565291 [Aspergillus transmontanensis]|uniref:Cytochrome P450 n=1 Tax=Aspergillus transmontanensis TaxID=1034304 RepID=A0A5N6VU05_9EURO|nr:hypothetical protein BDV41DRAFT_565291 [Aspergillus transmontanensis]
MSLFLLSVLLLLLFLSSTLYRLVNIRRKRSISPSIDPEIYRRIIEGKGLYQEVHNQLNARQSRAIPNQRLRAVFGIENALTTDNEIHAKRFLRQAKGLINLSPTAWESLSGLVRSAARRSIDGAMANNPDKPRVMLTNLVQVLVLRVVLSVLFRIETGALEIPDDDLLRLAEAINDAWTSSKDKAHLVSFEDNISLQNSLKTVFPHLNCLDSQENPLNLVIPGFETMWRIVLRLFIEINYTSGLQHPEWQGIMAAFAHAPTKDEFERRNGEKSVSAEMLVNEALRLYPPTKRVYRAFHPMGSDAAEVLKADIEKAQTATHIWGSDAGLFDPRRWGTLTPQQKLAFFPFGSKPFVCPAQAAFGPRAIALVVGALLVELGGEWSLCVGAECTGSLVPGVRLSNERTEYRDLCLARAGPV